MPVTGAAGADARAAACGRGGRRGRDVALEHRRRGSRRRSRARRRAASRSRRRCRRRTACRARARRSRRGRSCPPESVTIAAARRISGTQSGAVMCATSTSPSSNCAASASVVSTRTAPARGARRGSETAQQHGPAARWARCAAAAVPRRRGDRPRLEHPDVAVGVKGPLRVLRRAVVVLDADRRAPRGCEPRRRSSAGACGSSSRQQPRLGAPVGRGLDHELLGVDLARDDRERGPCRRRSGRARRCPTRPPRRGRRSPRSRAGRCAPLAGSMVNITPARVEAIWRCTTTAMSMSACAEAALARGSRPSARRTARPSSDGRRRGPRRRRGR